MYITDDNRLRDYVKRIYLKVMENNLETSYRTSPMWEQEAYKENMINM